MERVLPLCLILLAVAAAGCRQKSQTSKSPASTGSTSTSPNGTSAAVDNERRDVGTTGGGDGPAMTDADQIHPDPILGIGYVDASPDEADEEDAGVVMLDRDRSYPGYNLIEVVKLRRAELIDADGNIVHTWHHGDNGQWERCVLLPNGDLLVISFTEPHFILRLNWNNDVVWKRNGLWHHDLVSHDDGTISALRWEYRRIPAIDPDVDSMDNLITRFDPSGSMEVHRSLYDVLSSKPELFQFQPGREHAKEEGHPERIDLIHANSLWWISPQELPGNSPIYGLGNVLVCCRHQDSVVIFNWESAELLWAWGQGELEGPHDAQMLDNGHILIFDNGREMRRSRVLEIDPLTRKIVWQYVAPNARDFFSTARGANQRLPNGNTLITESNRGRAFEVTRDGEIVWQYFNPHRDERNRIAAINRCYRYEPSLVEPLLENSGPRAP